MPDKLSVTDSASPQSSEAGAASRKTQGCAELVEASLHLPSQAAAYPESLRAAAYSVLPNCDRSIVPAQGWAPVLAWIALRALPSAAAALALYDELRLRHALADCFSATGLEGEQTWRAAAQVRVLLKVDLHPSLLEALRTEEFWRDPDVRWLAGANTAGEEDYFHQESIEALVCWLQLPALISAVEASPASTKAADLSSRPGEVAATAAHLRRLASTAGYNVRRFRDLLQPEAAAAAAASEPASESSTSTFEEVTA